MLVQHMTRKLAATMTIAAALPCALPGQEAEVKCAEGEVVVGALGYGKLECECTISYLKNEPGRALYEFRSEPRIWNIFKDGPANKKLREGDVVIAVDGSLITTAEGGRKFGGLTPGVPVTLTVRRGATEIDVTITPEAKCREWKPELPPPAPDVAGVEERVRWAEQPRVGIEPVPPPPPEQTALPSGWMGFSFSCSHCMVGREEGEGHPVWDFTSPPQVERVEATSPAAAAGLRPGDVLTHLNGVALTSGEGGRLLGAIQPGDTLVFRYSRGDQSRTAQLVAGERVAARGEPVPPPKRGEEITRFSGVVGNAFIEVTGGTISVSRTDDEVVIRSRDITVRIKKTGG